MHHQALDHRTAQRTLVLFMGIFLLSAVASPLLLVYELLAGAGGLVATGLLARRRNGRSAMTATVVFAGILAGALPYLAAALLLS